MIGAIRKFAWFLSWHFHLVRIRYAIAIRRAAMYFGHRSYIESILTKSELRSSRSIAIIALYPIENQFYYASLENLLIGLDRNGMNSICIVNGGMNDRLSIVLDKFDCSVVLRKNKGRDFGAYQDGFNWLINNIELDVVERITFVNDTLLWVGSSECVIRDCTKGDWTTLYFNLEQHAHAQSFFLSFSKAVFLNKKFRKFWNSYAATKYRRAAILFGEMELSSVLLKEGFSCNPLVNSDWIHSKFTELPESSNNLGILKYLEINPLWKTDVPGVSRTSNNFINETTNLEKSLENNSEIGDSKIFKELTPLLLSRYCHSQGPHRIGLILYVLFGIPLKADLYKANSLAEITAAVRDRNPEFATAAHEFYMLQSQRYMLGSRENKRLKRRGEK
jgi:hypothetical protein